CALPIFRRTVDRRRGLPRRRSDESISGSEIHRRAHEEATPERIVGPVVAADAAFLAAADSRAYRAAIGFEADGVRIAADARRILVEQILDAEVDPVSIAETVAAR